MQLLKWHILSTTALRTELDRIAKQTIPLAVFETEQNTIEQCARHVEMLAAEATRSKTTQKALTIAAESIRKLKNG